MATAAALPVLLAELIEALDDSASWTRFHYLDRNTGEIATGLTEEVDKSGHFADVRDNPQRYVRIEVLPAWLRMQVRAQFVEQRVDDAALRLDLNDSLAGPHGIAGFERLLRNHAAVSETFFSFRTAALSDAARAWLLAHKLTKVDLK